MDFDTRSLARQFDDKYGKYVYGGDGWLYFECGAARENNPMGRLIEPHDINTYERLSNSHAYYQTKLDGFVERFETIKEEYGSYANNVKLQGYSASLMSEEEMGLLQKLKAAAKFCRSKLAEIEKKIAATPQGRADQAREERQARINEENEKVLAYLRKLRRLSI